MQCQRVEILCQKMTQMQNNNNSSNTDRRKQSEVGVCNLPAACLKAAPVRRGGIIRRTGNIT